MSESVDTVLEELAAQDEAAVAEFARLLTVKGLAPTHIQLDSKGTVVGGAPATLQGRLDPMQLPEVLASTAPYLTLGRVLGAGGMGIVRAALQAGLEREVAVKLVPSDGARATVGTTAMQAALLREARIAGAIAHPNVVPVHMLGRDAEGRPVMVMKAVDGRSWQDVLDGEGLVVGAHEALLADVRIERHLRILVGVCNAIEYAHSRGILHRDLKPDNVLLGAFGEVYVVDWGIAMAVPGASTVPGVPAPADSDHVCGTPAYMGPELASGRGSQQGPATDVYLLGAILHQLLVGEPPHLADSAFAMLTKAYLSKPPEFQGPVPAELAAICTRAMAADPTKRYGTVRELHDALESFLFTRSAIRLRDEATDRLKQLRQQLTHPDVGGEANSGLFKTYSECRFAFEQAQRALPTDASITAGIQEAVDLMVTRALSLGNYVAAEALLGEAPSPRPEHVSQTRQLRQAAMARDLRLNELEHRANPTVGDRLRSIQTAIVGTLWMLAHVWLGHLHRSGVTAVADWGYSVVLCAFMFGIMGLVVRNRQVIWHHTVNRITVMMCLCQLLTFAVMWPVMLRLGMGMGEAYAVGGIALAMLSLLAATAAAQWTLLIPVVMFGLAAPLVLAWSQWMFEVGGVMTTGSLFGMASVWHLRAARRASRRVSSSEPDVG